MLHHECQYGIDLARAEAARLREVHRYEPRLHRRFRLIDVDMRRLIRLMAVKVEAVAIVAQKGGHVLRGSFLKNPRVRRQRLTLKRLKFPKASALSISS